MNILIDDIKKHVGSHPLKSYLNNLLQQKKEKSLEKN